MVLYMRILLIIKSFNFGGAENHVCDLANAMDELDNEIFIAGAPGSQIQRLNKRVHFIPLRMTDIILPFQVIHLCFLLAKYKIEVIHAHKRIAILLASIAGKIMKIPVVATVHGRPRHDLRSFISRDFADRIIFVSKRTRDANSKLRGITAKSVIIPNGVAIFENTTEKDYYSISYISRIDKKHSSIISLIIKEVLPDILRDFPAVSLNIIGEGKYLRRLKKEAEKLNSINKREVCKIHGYLPEVKSVIRKSGVVLGVGRAAIESLSCAVPVILLNQKFMGRFVTEQNFQFHQLNNFVPVTHDAPDPLILADILRNYFTNPEQQQKEAINLLKMVQETLSIQKVSGDILEIYKEASKSK